MSKVCWYVAVTTLLWASPATWADDLTLTERTWLEAAGPVLAFARQQALPLDIIVQPQPTPGESPLGMAFVAGRCKLVLSMRGNPETQSVLDGVDADLIGPVVEAMAAHELAHCWRHLQRNWGTLPAEAIDVSTFGALPVDLADRLRDMWQARREEGYADLVGLAWTLQHHPDRYADVHAWHVRLRAGQALESGPHDTRVWVRLAADPARFAHAASIFENVEPVWLAGLVAGS